MVSQPGKSFNVATDKVVNLVEWKFKARTLLNKELSLKENTLAVIVDSPLCAAGAAAKIIKGIFNKKSKIGGMYVDAKHTGLFGVYITGAAAQEMMRLLPDNTRKEKIYRLCEKAFEQSEDVRAKPVIQRLKPLKL